MEARLRGHDKIDRISETVYDMTFDTKMYIRGQLPSPGKFFYTVFNQVDASWGVFDPAFDFYQTPIRFMRSPALNSVGLGVLIVLPDAGNDPELRFE